MEKILNCANLTDDEFVRVQRGLALMDTESGARYFGFVNKAGLKDLNKLFEYTDKSVMFKGVLIGAAIVFIVPKIYNKYKNGKGVVQKKHKESE